MLWQLFVGLAAFFVHPRGDDRFHVSPELEIYPYGPQNAEELAEAHGALHGDFPNGDMLFSEDEPSHAGTKDTKKRWPRYPGGGEVPYVIDSSVSSLEPLILQAMEQYNKLTCIKFVPRKSEMNYINIFKGVGCYSRVGRQGKGKQDMSLGDGCGYVGTIVHELGLAIGLYHQHQRSDRDTFITVNPKNVEAGKERNFNKILSSKELAFDKKKYDYSSIMHYGNYAFSKSPGELKTMEAKNGVKLLEPFNKPGLTNSDIDLVKKLYKCK